MPDATITQIYKFFQVEGYTLAQFRVEWAALSDEERTYFKSAIGETLNA